MSFNTSDAQYRDIFEFLVQQRYHYLHSVGVHRVKEKEGKIKPGEEEPDDPLEPYNKLLESLFQGYHLFVLSRYHIENYLLVDEAIANVELELYGQKSTGYSTFNRNKRSVALDLKAPAGKRAFLALIHASDVCLDNYAPGALDRLGLGWDTMAAENPRLVHMAIKGFLPGPYEHRPSLDELAQMMSGATELA
jgi:hypothetical protein